MDNADDTSQEGDHNVSDNSNQINRFHTHLILS